MAEEVKKQEVKKLKQGFSFKGINFKVSSDNMEVYMDMDVIPSEEEWKDLGEKLRKMGVYGVLERPKVVEDRVVVAEGTPPVPGEDGRIEYLIDTSVGPREVDKHRVDYREMNAVVCVKAGTPLARHVPPKPGIPGRNVFGEPIAPPDVKDVVVKYGSGVRYDKEKGLLIAEVDGCVVEKDGKISVFPTYTLEGDVGWDTGNIRFFGEKLRITGWVKRGFKVYAEGDVEIEGGVEDGVEIHVKGNLFVGALIHGESTSIRVEGNATIKAVEYATITVTEDLEVKDYALQAKIDVSGTLRAIEERGLIAAGEVTVGESAVVKVLGNESLVPTTVKVGQPPELVSEISQLKEKLALLDELTDKLQKALVLSKKLEKEGRLSDEKKKLVEKVRDEFRKKVREQADLQELLREKEEELARSSATLQVLEKAYPGVVIYIGKSEFRVIGELEGPLEFYLDEKSRVRVRSLS